MRRTRWAGVAVAVGLMLSLAACMGADAGDSGPSAGAGGTGVTAAPATVAAATVAVATVAAAAPEASAPPDIFTGTDRCQVRTTPPAAGPDTWTSACDRTTNDSRMNGQYTITVTGIDGDPTMDMAMGSATLVNAGGSWECVVAWVGAAGANALPRDEVCLGHGGYIGLTAYVHGLSGTDSFTSGVIGSIEKTP